MRNFLILIILVFPKLIYGQAGWLDSLDNYIAKEVVDYNVIRIYKYYFSILYLVCVNL